MKYILIIALLVFSGCNDKVDYAKQFVECSDHEGVFSFGKTRAAIVKCNDGFTSEKWTNNRGKDVAEALKILKDSK